MRSVSMIGGSLLIRESQDLGSSCDDRSKEPRSIYGRFRGPETGFRLKEITSQSPTSSSLISTGHSSTACITTFSPGGKRSKPRVFLCPFGAFIEKSA